MPSGGAQALYRYTIDSVSEYAILAVSTAGEVLSWNSGAERFFGYTAAEIIGTPFDVFFTVQDRADGTPVEELAVAAAEGRVDRDRWHVRKDGTQFWGCNTVQPLHDESGNINAFTKIVRDTTELYEATMALRQSEHRLRILVESVVDYAIFSTDPDGCIVIWSAGAQNVFGFTPADIVGKPYAQLFSGEDMKLGVPAQHLEVALVNAVCSDERWLMREGGVPFFAKTVIAQIRDGTSDARGFVIVAHDVTARKELDNQREAAAADIARASETALNAAKLKSQFVATMSHEIRTPISGVIGMTELLLLTSLDDEQREYAKVVNESGQSLLRIINDILDYSKIEANAVDLESIEFDLEEQIRAVTDLLSVEAGQKAINVTARLHSLAGPRVVGDPGRLRQVLANLVGNALKFTPQNGHVEIEAVLTRSDDALINGHFEIRDSGIGIDIDVQRKLFQPFVQGDGSTTRRFGGTGLGLSISKQLVELMGGTIGVRSMGAQGSTFWFTLPFLVCLSETTEPDAAIIELPQSAEAHSEKILLVEDNSVNRLLAHRQFEKLGFQLTSVTNGREAVDAVKQGRYDLVFMDCNMPEMDGFEATKEIRLYEAASGKRLPIIAMTAAAQSEDRSVCLAAGMDDYLSKPSDLASIRMLLDRWLPAVK